MNAILFAAIAFATFRPLPERIAASDFVGLVEIRSSTTASRPGEYLRVADAWVLEALKGDDIPSRIAINFDSGETCPNVIYHRDETYLVFLSREPDGTYTSVATTRYKVEQGAVDHWQGRGVVPLDDIKREIARLVAP